MNPSLKWILANFQNFLLFETGKPQLLMPPARPQWRTWMSSICASFSLQSNTSSQLKIQDEVHGESIQNPMFDDDLHRHIWHNQAPHLVLAEEVCVYI